MLIEDDEPHSRLGGIEVGKVDLVNEVPVVIETEGEGEKTYHQ